MGQQPAVVLCGLPGAGKSTVSHILRTQFENVEIVCQDDMVKGRSTEDEIARIVHDQRKLLVIDRCNVTIKDREQIAQWLGDRRKILLCMDTMVNLCADRARARQEHPTLAADRAASVISMLNKKYVRPSPQTDKLYDAVFVVRSDDELAHFFALQFGFVWESTFEAVPAHTPILKFPRTPHIVSLGSATRDDLIMEEDPDSLFSCANATKHLVVEEKIDGANLGISLTEDYRIVCQNRSHYVTSESHPQFHDLDKWLHRFESNLCRLLVPGRHILYGEWMSTTHSVHYDALPGLFVAFDLYDRFTAKFLSRDSLEHLFTSLYITIPLTPVLHRGPFEAHWKDVLLRLIHERSCFSSSEKREGVYVRIMDEENQWLLHRCKLVRGDFLAEGTAHWTRGPVRANRMTARFK
jgi:atypical dual specificity phosphatase